MLGWVMARIALLLQYVGTNYCGWQRQPHDPSIQEVLEDTIASVCGHPVVLHGAGRTDTGVHAAGQVAHFDTDSTIPADRWARILNSRLPKDILVRESVAVPPTWHARFSALWRKYRYTLFTAAVPNIFVRPLSWHYYYYPLDVDRMQAALTPLVGERELKAFQRSGSSRPHARLEVQEAKCWRDRDFILVEVRASGFLYGMMRLLVGMLVEVGSGRKSLQEFREIWQQHQRSAVKYAAPPQGLCLLGVGYPESPFQWQDQPFAYLI
ncbi:MAG: tRNA pseudouridine(38-40) synthase TruA [Pseudanabaenaceae cyanobacterium]